MGHPVPRQVFFRLIGLVKDQHNFAVSDAGNVGQLLCINLSCAAFAAGPDTYIWVEEQVGARIAFEVIHHRWFREPCPVRPHRQHFSPNPPKR